jgi:hypothetical protein
MYFFRKKHTIYSIKNSFYEFSIKIFLNLEIPVIFPEKHHQTYMFIVLYLIHKKIHIHLCKMNFFSFYIFIFS